MSLSQFVFLFLRKAFNFTLGLSYVMKMSWSYPIIKLSHKDIIGFVKCQLQFIWFKCDIKYDLYIEIKKNKHAVLWHNR